MTQHMGQDKSRSEEHDGPLPQINVEEVVDPSSLQSLRYPESIISTLSKVCDLSTFRTEMVTVALDQIDPRVEYAVKVVEIGDQEFNDLAYAEWQNARKDGPQIIVDSNRGVILPICPDDSYGQVLLRLVLQRAEREYPLSEELTAWLVKRWNNFASLYGVNYSIAQGDLKALELAQEWLVDCKTHAEIDHKLGVLLEGKVTSFVTHNPFCRSAILSHCALDSILEERGVHRSIEPVCREPLAEAELDALRDLAVKEVSYLKALLVEPDLPNLLRRLLEVDESEPLFNLFSAGSATEQLLLVRAPMLRGKGVLQAKFISDHEVTLEDLPKLVWPVLCSYPGLLDTINGALLFHGTRSGSLLSFSGLQGEHRGELLPIKNLLASGMAPFTGELGTGLLGISQRHISTYFATQFCSVLTKYVGVDLRSLKMDSEKMLRPRLKPLPDGYSKKWNMSEEQYRICQMIVKQRAKIFGSLNRIEKGFVRKPFPVLFGIRPMPGPDRPFPYRYASLFTHLYDQVTIFGCVMPREERAIFVPRSRLALVQDYVAEFDPHQAELVHSFESLKRPR